MERYVQAKNVSLVGMIANILLAAIKVSLGLVSNSQAMIADGLNSVGDVFSSFMTWIGNKISSKPEDEDHPYGHGKSEYIFSFIIGLSLIIVAINVMTSSINSLILKETVKFSIILIIVAIGNIIVKAILYVYANKIGKLYNNLLVIANAKDHRNDIMLTLITLISIIFSKFNIYFIDGIAGIIISIWIAITGISIIYDAYKILMDTNLDEKYIEKIKNTIISIEGVFRIDAINSKPTGFKYLIILEIAVSGDITVNEGHCIAHKVKEQVNNLDNIYDTIVHINPYK